MFCASGLIFGGSEGAGSRFHVLRSRTHFGRYRGRQILFSCFALRLVWGRTVGVGSRFHILRSRRSRTCSGRYRGRRIPFSCFALSNPFWGGTEGVRSSFHVLRSCPRLGRYRGRRVSFSCFARQASFSMVPRASGPVFMFCAPRLVFEGTKDVGSRLLVLCSRTNFRRYRVRRVSFSFFALPDSFHVLGCTEGVRSHFHVLLFRTHLRQYLGRRTPFSCFTFWDSFSTVPRTSGPVYIFCAPRQFEREREGEREIAKKRERLIVLIQFLQLSQV
jgi:hypothetical protein